MNAVTQKLPGVARVALGLIFLVFGLNGFFHFLPAPPPPASALGFVGGLASAPYFFPLLKGTEVVAGVLLLSNRFVPLALTLLAPIIVNIAAFHLFLAPSPGMVVALLAAEIYLAWSYRAAFRGVLAAHAKPAPVAPSGRTIEAAAE
ncbi:MAG: DoxX family protein [Labilithrix sp.]|nr:DoxX family protein [Labilithrix sp.]